MTPIPTFQDQLNELQHQIDSLNAKLNHAEGEIMWLRGFLAGQRQSPAQPYVTLPYIQPDITYGPPWRVETSTGTCAREPNGFDHFDTETGVIRAIPTTDNDEGPEALAAQQQALTDPDDYLGNLV